VRDLFIIKETITGHSVRIQIDSCLDLNYISERFNERHNLLSRRHPDPVRIRKFNENLTGNKQIEVLVILEEVKVERLKLDLVITDVNAILEVRWFRRIDCNLNREIIH
jgi:hypothetical protein